MHDWRLLQQLNSQHSSSVVLASCNYVLLLKPKFALLATLEILQLAKSAWTTFMERTARSSAKGNGTAPEMVGARESMGAVCAMRDSRERPNRRVKTLDNADDRLYPPEALAVCGL